MLCRGDGAVSDLLSCPSVCAQINVIEKGGYLGELALITKNPRAASAYAVGDVRLAFLDREAFERLLGPCMDVMKREMENYEEELQKIFGSSVNISDVR